LSTPLSVEIAPLPSFKPPRQTADAFRFIFAFHVLSGHEFARGSSEASDGCFSPQDGCSLAQHSRDLKKWWVNQEGHVTEDKTTLEDRRCPLLVGGSLWASIGPLAADSLLLKGRMGLIDPLLSRRRAAISNALSPPLTPQYYGGFPQSWRSVSHSPSWTNVPLRKSSPNGDNTLGVGS
jgi:hypothetical protein